MPPRLSTAVARRAPAPAAIFAFAGALAAQQFAPLPGETFPANATAGRAVAAGDLDGDAWPDVVIGQDGAPPRLLRGTGGGAFALLAATAPAIAMRTRAVVLADVDGDRDLDVVFGNVPGPGASGANALWLNDGRGAFTDASSRLPPHADPTQALAAGDVDTDGDIDLVAGNGDPATGTAAQSRLYLNDGTGTFTDATAMLPARGDLTQALALGDVDGDGDLDLVLGNGAFALGTAAPDRLLRNDGRGAFSDVAGALPARSEVTNALALHDLDGDHDLDLVSAHGSAASASPATVDLNDGAGRFAPAPFAFAPLRGSAVAVADFDADGRPDVALGAFRERNRLFLGAGGATFVESPALPDETQPTRALLAADLDLDAIPDLIEIADGRANAFFDLAALPRSVTGPGAHFADARGAFVLPVAPRATAATVLIDIDADLDLDLVVAGDEHDAPPVMAYRNDGRGGFTAATGAIPAPPGDKTACLAAGDMDGDGDVDLFAGNDGQNRLYLNDGTGAFIDDTAALPPLVDDTRAAVLADLDADGDLDLAFAVHLATWTLLLRADNDGAGRFAWGAWFPVGTFYFLDTRAIAAGDVDGDGDQDLVLGNGQGRVGQPNLLLRNLGGVFGPDWAALPQVAEPTVGLLLQDLDGDRDLDLVAANADPAGAGGHPARLYRNDGGGTFSDATSWFSPPPFDAASASAGDVDDDGDQDLVFGAFPYGAMRLYLNANNTGFADASARLAAPAPGAPALAFGDVDGDQDPDLVVATDAPRLHVNLHRQLWAPRLARVGFRWTLRLHSQPGYGPALQGVVPLLGLRALAPPLQLGSLGALRVDPTQALVLPVLALPPAGTLDLAFTVPSLMPPLAGQRLHAQCVFLPGASPSTWRLGNATFELVLP